MMKRIFVVGASRSGTTVVQRVLSERLNLYSLPETAFFMEELGSASRRLSALTRLYRSVCAAQLKPKGQLGVHVSHFALVPAFLRHSGLWGTTRAIVNSPREAASIFSHVLSKMAQSYQCVGWLEKTPLHCMHIPHIRNMMQPDGFVFVLRNGPDTTASIRDRAIKYTEQFGWQAGPQRCVNIWNSAVDVAAHELGANDIYFISYEKFVNAPDAAARAVGDHFGVTVDTVPAQAKATRAHHTLAEEQWKANASGVIQPQKSKWNEVFSEDERAFILSRLDETRYRAILDSVRHGHSLGFT